MTLYLSNRDGNGKTSEEGHYRFQTSIWSGSILGDTDLQVTQNSPLGMSVVVAAGQFKIDTSGGYSYTGWNSAPETIAITTADPANPRITSIVAYVDKTATTSPTPPNNPGIVKIVAVNGSASAVPVAPNSSAIQTAVGASNPYIVLAEVRVNAAVTQVLNANITDRREKLSLRYQVVNEASIINSSVTSNKLADSAVTASKIADLATTTTKLADGAVTTAKFRPSIIDSNFTVAGSRYTTPNGPGFFSIPNASMTYTAGSTNETLILTTSAMAIKNSTGNAELYLYVNGVAFGFAAHLEAANPWYRMNVTNFVPVNAGQTVSLSVVIYVNTSTASVTNEQSRWKPAIQGFSVYRP